MSLYQKHRPKSFSEIVGNKELVSVLQSIFEDKKKMPHAFLFHGPTGCGKTTIARIICAELECAENNIVEIDTAQFNGIDTVRDIRKSAQFIPLGGGSRVFIIDEVHRMTSDAQNAFLKILEDTPPHIYFILCTTNEGSLLPALKGRCSQFKVTTLTDDEMTSLLRKTARKEGYGMNPDVVEQIVKSAQGHPRNALTILQQVLSIKSDKERIEVAKRAQIVETETRELCQLLLKKANWKQVSTVLRGLKQEEAETIRRTVLGYMSAVLLNTDNPQAGFIMECFEEPMYNIGFPGVTLACYRIIKGE